MTKEKSYCDFPALLRVPPGISVIASDQGERGNLGLIVIANFFIYSIIFFVGRTRSTLGRICDFARSGRAENNSLTLRQILGRSLCSLSGLPLASSGRPQVSLCPTHRGFKKQNL